jgi:ribosomal protein S20
MESSKSFVEFMTEKKKERSKQQKTEYKTIIKRIKKKIDKKIRRNKTDLSDYIIVDASTSLSTLLKLEKAGFSVSVIIIPELTWEDLYATAPRNVSGLAWEISW